MKKRTVVVSNRTGVHARPSAAIVKLAARFEARITIRNKEQAADASSTMSVMMLAMAVGEFVEIEAEGPDEELAAEAIARLFVDEFGEWNLYD